MTTLNAHDRRFAVRLARIRKLRELTQQQLADAAGLHRAVIAGIETNARSVRLGEAVDLCAALDVDLCEVLADRPMHLRTETPVD